MTSGWKKSTIFTVHERKKMHRNGALRLCYHGNKKGNRPMDFQKLTEYRNQQNRFAQRIGMALEEIRPGYARVVKTVDADDANPLGVPHGGVYFSMSDNACGSAMASYGYMAVTLNASYQFFRSARVGDHLTAEAREIKHGKTVSVYEARVTNQDGILLGTGTFTFFQLDQKIEL